MKEGDRGRKEILAGRQEGSSSGSQLVAPSQVERCNLLCYQQVRWELSVGSQI